MRKIMILTIFCILGRPCFYFVYAQSTITIRLSYKVVLNPANGSRPAGVNNNNIDNAIAGMNTLLGIYFRGHRFQRVDPITNVGGQNDATGPSMWFNTNFFGDNGNALKDQMEQAALNNRTAYAWNPNAINIYITNGICGGICSFPHDPDNIIIVGACSNGNAPLQLHEIGHYFNLFHTQGSNCGSCDPTQTGICHTIPGDDQIIDTLPDLQCWDQDDIANWSFNSNYTSLNLNQRNQVDDAFLNIMSYHNNITRLTELQLDRWTDAANADRRNVATGRTYFVQLGSTPLPIGSSTTPISNVQTAIAVASSGDIIIIRPGTYSETLNSNKAVTLRATREGPVVIGTSSTVAFARAELRTTEDIKGSEQALKELESSLGGPAQKLDFPGK